MSVSDHFRGLGQFFQHPGCAQTPCRRHLARFSLIFGPWVTRFVSFSTRLGASETENYLLKRKPE
jgi:hypothetical protein